MKSKILALSKNEEFRKLLKRKKISNKYVTIFFGHLNNKNEKIHLFPKLEYSHISHNFMIKNNLVRNLTINSKLKSYFYQRGVLYKT